MGEDKDIFCEKCYKEETARRHRASSRSRSRLDSMSKEDLSNAVEITEIVSQEDLVAQAMIETTTIMADDLDSNKCSRLVKIHTVPLI